MKSRVRAAGRCLLTPALLLMVPVSAGAADPGATAGKVAGIPPAGSVSGASYLHPVFERTSGGAVVRNALSQARVPNALQDGIRVGAVVLHPTGALESSGQASVIDDDFAVYEAPGIDTVIATAVNGLRVYTRIAAASTDAHVGWRLDDTFVRAGDDGA